MRIGVSDYGWCMSRVGSCMVRVGQGYIGFCNTY